MVPRLVAFLLDNLNSQPQLRRLLHVAAFELPESDKMIREHLTHLDMVCAYFKRCAEKGAMRNVEPSLATLGLTGAITAHYGLCLLFTGEPPYPSDEQALSAYAILWLNGPLPGKNDAAAPAAEIPAAALPLYDAKTVSFCTPVLHVLRSPIRPHHSHGIYPVGAGFLNRAPERRLFGSDAILAADG